MSALMGWILKSHREMYARERAESLRAYRYRGVDYSPISKYILTPYWNWAVTLLPTWMAPNLVTLIGFLFIVFAYVLVVVFIPDLVGPAPSRFFYFFFAACFWIYSTMDNIDGKQARRTGSSSPLGELFDHGCDALNCPIGALVQIAALGLGTSQRSLLVLFISCWAFYLPTWEEYHTGVLKLGVVNGPTEGLLAAMLLMLVSGVFGPEIWMRPVAWIPAVGGFSGWRLVDPVLIVFMTLFLCYYIPDCLLTVKRACREKGTSFSQALAQLFPMALGTVSVGLWLGSPWSRAQSSHFILFFTAVGIAFGKMATKIIYAHVAKCEFPYWTGLAMPLVLGAFGMTMLPLLLPSNARTIQSIHHLETAYLWGYLVICMVGYANWIKHAIASICMHCDIYCLRIKENKMVVPAAAEGDVGVKSPLVVGVSK